MAKKKPAPAKQKKAAKAEKPSVKRLRTSPLPGMADERIEAVRVAAYDFLDAAEAVANEKEKLKAAKHDLITVMHEHEITRYYDPESELLVTITDAVEKVKVLRGEAALAETGTSAARPADDPANYAEHEDEPVVTVGGGEGDAPEPA